MGIVTRRLFEPRNRSQTAAARVFSTSSGGLGLGRGGPDLSEAYYRNVTINAGLRLLARQVAEPRFIGKRFKRSRQQIRAESARLRSMGLRNDAGAKQIDGLLNAYGYTETVTDHPLVTLLNDPNPFMTGDELWGLTVVIDQWLAGNAYVLKGRTDLGNVGELWRLHPARVRVIPDKDEFIAGYEYRVNNQVFRFPREDIIHIKTLNPDDPYYGTPLLLPVLDSLQIDSDMKGYLKGFYLTGGGGPGAILTVEGELSDEEKEELRERKRRIFGGPAGAHEWLIIDNSKTQFQSLGLDRGLAAGLPKEVAAMVAADLSMALGIPGSILGQLIGYESSSYANKRQDWQVLWDITLTPQMEQLDNAINRAFLGKVRPEFGGIDEICSDLSSIAALQEDVDAIQERHRKNVMSGLESWEEGRMALGLDPNPESGTFLVPSTNTPTPIERLGELPEPPKAPVDVTPADPADTIAAHFRSEFARIDAPRGGRPPLLADPGARSIYERAVALRAKNPTWSWLQVADKIGISERQLRRYRGMFDE